MTDLHFFYDGVEIVNAIRFSQGTPGFATSAATGTVELSEVIIDDPDGSLTFETWHDFTVEEDDCSFPRLYTGVVMNKRIIRGPYRDGPARQHVLTLADPSTLLSMQIIDGTDGKRPAETDLARATWILGSGYLNGEITDTGADLTNDPINFGESDYRGQYPAEVFNSIAGTSGKTAFAYWNGSEITMHYDQNGVGIGDSTLTISNVIADQSSTCFYPSIDADLSQEGEDRYSGIYYGWLGGAFLQRNTTTETELGRRREIAYSTSRVGILATAQTLATQTLLDHTDDRHVITCGIEVPAASVNLVRAGMRIQVKFTHLEGYEALTWTYVRRIVVGQNILGLYRIKLTLDPLGILHPPGGGPPGEFPYEPSCSDGFAQIMESEAFQVGGGVEITNQYTRSWTPTLGRTTFIYGQKRAGGAGTPHPPTGFTELAFVGDGGTNPHETNGAVWYRVNEPGDTAAVVWASTFGPHLIWVEERDGQLEDATATELVSTDPYNVNSPFPGASITPTAGQRAVVVGYWFAKRNHGALSAGSGWTLLSAATTDAVITHGVVEQTISSASGAYVPSFTGANPAVFDNHSYGAITVAFSCEGQPPLPGQEVPPAPSPTTPDGGETVFASPWPYATGSLEVAMNGSHLQREVDFTESDAAAGELEFTDPPPADAQIVVWFRGR